MLAVVAASLVVVFADLDDRSRRGLPIAVGAIFLFALLGFVVVILTIWLHADEHERGSSDRRASRDERERPLTQGGGIQGPASHRSDSPH